MTTMATIKLLGCRRTKTQAQSSETNWDHYGSILIDKDGEPEALGAKLCNFLDAMQIGNDNIASEFANVAGCLYAQMVTYLKNLLGGSFTPGSIVGGVYLLPVGSESQQRGCLYEIRVYEDNEITIAVNNEPELSVADFAKRYHANLV